MVAALAAGAGWLGVACVDEGVALRAAGIPANDPTLAHAGSWLISKQKTDGGWGESNDTYAAPHPAGTKSASTPHQSAWALLGLLTAGQAGSDAVRCGVEYLLRIQQADGLWSDPSFTAPGFPRVFYLRYHGYCAYFPLWALAAYRTLARLGTTH